MNPLVLAVNLSDVTRTDIDNYHFRPLRLRTSWKHAVDFQRDLSTLRNREASRTCLVDG